MNKRFVYVNFEKEGIHRYIQAGEDPKLSDVSFLQYPHRHIFKFNVMIEVNHNDRDIEFIQLKRYCQSVFDNFIDANYKSCEMLGEDLLDLLLVKYGERYMKITVSEDGENGAVIEHYVD